MPRAPGTIRDAILGYLTLVDEASASEIFNAVRGRLGTIPYSSVRSYLNLNVPKIFERRGRGRFRLKQKRKAAKAGSVEFFTFKSGKAQLIPANCFDWLERRAACSVHAVITDPPYGLVEYTDKEQEKLRKGRGGIWRIPPAFDGHRRAPLPRFTVLTDEDRKELYAFFKRLGASLAKVTVPGANIVVASNPLLAHIVATAMAESGLELRGYVTRLTMTMRGGDRPKNAHHEFDGVSVMPRSMFEPWVILRRPLEGRVQDNLRKWKTGGFRRPNNAQPFGDVINSSPTPRAERKVAPHPSLKPQEFLRTLIRAALPLGEGVILDPFAGSGSTLAAAEAVGYESIGLERDPRYYRMATKALPLLAKVKVNDAPLASAASGVRSAAAKRPNSIPHPKGRRSNRKANG
jgi:DNA modification methylase